MTLCPIDPWLARSCAAYSTKPVFPDSPVDPEAVRGFQLQALRCAFTLAYRRASFYKKYLSASPMAQLAQIRAGQWPPDLESLSQAPFTFSADISADWRQFLCVGLSDVARMVSLQTSGTTGVPKRLAFSRGDLERTMDFFSIGISVLARPGDTVLILLPGADKPEGVTSLLISALERLGARGIAGSSQAEPEVFLAELKRHRPQCLVAAPRQLRRLLGVDDNTAEYPVRECRSAVQTARREAARSIRAVLVSSEPFEPELGRQLRDSWECLVIDHYGLTESGYGGGVECLAHSGYHLRENDLYFEVVDPVTGAVLPDGEPGEVVFTTLSREAMPLLRYRTGDFAAMLPGPCACGSRMRRLGIIQGRIERDYEDAEIMDTVDNAISAGRDDPEHSGTIFRTPQNKVGVKSVRIVRPEKGSFYAYTTAPDL